MRKTYGIVPSALVPPGAMEEKTNEIYGKHGTLDKCIEVRLVIVPLVWLLKEILKANKIS